MRKSTSSIHKILDILLLFQYQQESLSIEEICQGLDMPKSTAYRYVRILCERGFLERRNGANYQLGLTFLALSRTALHINRDIRRAAFPSMSRIAEKVGESVSLMRLFNKQVICIESIEGRHALRITMEQGRVQPLHAGASSKLLLAYLHEEEWGSRLEFPLERLTATTLVDFDLLKKELKRIRQRGFSTSDGEIDVGARAVAVPIRDYRNDVVAALSIEGPSARVSEEMLLDYVEILHREAEFVRRELS